MEAQRNKEVLDGMRSATHMIADPVTSFAETMRSLDIRVGMHNYVGFDGEPVVLVIAREDRAAEIEAAVNAVMDDAWQADSKARTAA